LTKLVVTKAVHSIKHELTTLYDINHALLLLMIGQMMVDTWKS